jgi:hypothetical protein
MQQRAFIFGSKSYVIRRVFLEYEIKTLKIQTRSCKYIIEYCAAAQFSELTAEKAKLKINPSGQVILLS